MNKANKTKMIWGVIVALVIFVAILSTGGGGAHDEFAQCLTERGAIMYGAFWCPHCSDQKALFGKSWKKVNYVECSNQDRSQTTECANAGIQSYPTWQFADGSRQGGAIPLQQLSALTGCPL